MKKLKPYKPSIGTELHDSSKSFEIVNKKQEEIDRQTNLIQDKRPGLLRRLFANKSVLREADKAQMEKYIKNNEFNLEVLELGFEAKKESIRLGLNDYLRKQKVTMSIEHERWMKNKLALYLEDFKEFQHQIIDSSKELFDKVDKMNSHPKLQKKFEEMILSLVEDYLVYLEKKRQEFMKLSIEIVD